LEGKKKFVKEGIRKECQDLAAKTVGMLINLMREKHKLEDVPFL